MSFFLWSSIPDEPLLDLAERGTLTDPQILEQQVRRMLADARATALVDDFAAQWLHFRKVVDVLGDPLIFPNYDDNLIEAFRRETELFIASTLREDRSVLDLLRADYTFVNERLARHYGIPGVYGSRFRASHRPEHTATRRIARARRVVGAVIVPEPDVARSTRQMAAGYDSRGASTGASVRRAQSAGGALHRRQDGVGA